MTQIRPLIDILAEIPDFQNEKGNPYPLSAILALAYVAIMCGAKGYCAIGIRTSRNRDIRHFIHS